MIAFDEDRSRSAACAREPSRAPSSQQPYEWGYQGMKLMAGPSRGRQRRHSETKLVIVPTKIIDKANVDAFEAELKSRIGG